MRNKSINTNIKILVSIFVFLLLFSPVLFSSDDFAESLNGTVKKVSTYISKYNNDNSHNSFLYEKNLIKVEEYEDGLLIGGEKHVPLNSFNDVEYVYTYSQDGILQLKEIFNLESGKIDFEIRYTYDKNGNLIEKQTLNSSLEEELRTIYVWKDSMLLEERNIVDGKEGMNIIYSYEGNTTSSISSLRDKIILEEYVVFNDFHRPVILERDYKVGEYSTGETIRWEYSYEKNVLQKVEIWEDGKITKIIEYTKRDEYGNWIEKLEIKNPGNVPTVHTFREIEYY